MSKREEGQALAAEVATVIEKHEKRYDQGTYRHEEGGSSLCGTPGCIAGWTMWILEGRRMEYGVPGHLQQRWFGLGTIEAGHALGLTNLEARTMFDPDPYEAVDDRGDLIDVPNATPAEAAAVLRHYAETGQVCWPLR